ncbi:MAG: class I SAM-dependent methyltransferase [Ignavibacteria bacterium]|nr:class I SAM-dependent methyltransferase [Ignavibacteria bacterium]
MNDEVNITGWDFSQLTETGRMNETPLPWDYHAIVKQYIPGAGRMLDMGTGGGEFLKTLAPLPQETYATEGYAPNVKIAEENLKPLGVKVISGYKDSKLPLENDFFDLVINRHEYYEPAEVHRILKPGGYFITQQVKGNCDDTITELFGAKADIEFKDWSLAKAVNESGKLPFEMIRKEDATGFTVFKDIEALVSYIKVINWLVPDFTRDKYSAEIETARKTIIGQGSFKSTLDRFLIICKKTA